MRTFQYLLFVLKRSYICYFLICMTVALSFQIEILQRMFSTIMEPNQE